MMMPMMKMTAAKIRPMMLQMSAAINMPPRFPFLYADAAKQIPTTAIRTFSHL